MIFPFSIKCTRKFREKIDISDADAAMSYIQDFIEGKTCENTLINGLQLTYKTGSFRNTWNNNTLTLVDKGKFELINSKTVSILTYEFFMYHFFLSAIIMSVLIGVISSQFLTGVLFFVFIGGLNWAIIIIRQRIMLKDIVLGIETLINEKKGSL